MTQRQLDVSGFLTFVEMQFDADTIVKITQQKNQPVLLLKKNRNKIILSKTQVETIFSLKESIELMFSLVGEGEKQ